MPEARILTPGHTLADLRITKVEQSKKNRKLDTPIGSHFNSPGHTLADLKITIVEQSKRNNHPFKTRWGRPR